MGQPIIKGYTGPMRQKWGVKWSPSNGGDFSEQYIGTDIGQMLSLAGINSRAGLNCDLSFSKNVAELTISSTDPAQYGLSPVFSSITDKWEVGVDQERPDLFENPNFLSIFDYANTIYGITTVEQQFFQLFKNISSDSSAQGSYFSKFIDAISTTELYDDAGTVIPPVTLDPDTYTAMWECYSLKLNAPNWSGLTGQQAFKFFFDEYSRGRTNFAHGKYVLKHTTIAPQTYASNVTDFNVEKIYSIPQLLSEAENSTLWILPLPGYLAYKILAYPVPVNMPPLYQWGALKMRGNAVVAAKGRIEISQEYLIDAVAVPTYGTI